MNLTSTSKVFKNILLLLVFAGCLSSCVSIVNTSYVGKGWSGNSVNTVKFRKNAITTYGTTQFAAYYNQNAYVVLAKRQLNSKMWEVHQTQYKGNIKDAHNSISIAVDGSGVLHVSWDHHNTPLRYAKSTAPLSLTLGEIEEMTGKNEEKVTYPEFYNLPNGNLMFFYRSGESGRGNLVINSYDQGSQTWRQLQSNLIDGEDQRSAYWQACVDRFGTLHVSWVWRETWDVETNHDICYARSKDGGKTWEKSNGELYSLPITKSTAEYAWKIPEQNNLINQTSMTSDENGNPYIVSYWNVDNVPQYQIVYLDKGNWKKINTSFRDKGFSLGGGGTKRIPIARPDILTSQIHGKTKVSILFRDESRNNVISIGSAFLEESTNWKLIDITESSVGQWEPNYDIALWNSKHRLDIFSQNVTQIDGEGVSNSQATDVKVFSINNVTRLKNK